MNAKLPSIGSTIDSLIAKGKIPDRYEKILKDFFSSYTKVALSHKYKPKDFVPIFSTFIHLIEKQFLRPYQFDLYHKRIRQPFDYTQFGLDFMNPLVNLADSSVFGHKHLDSIREQLDKKENVILLANHQIEADPMAITILLEPNYPTLAEKLIFVAGARVTTDPLAIPFSMGCNLLCIHSKKHMDTPPELKHTKQMHNKRTMQRMTELLTEGGHIIYVAPSGGRDRMNKQGEIEVAPFDPQSIEMFYLMAKKAKRPTHFYTLALSTYHLLPPPETIESEVGEIRITHGGSIHLAFGPEIDMDTFPGQEIAKNKYEKRKIRANYLWKYVQKDYNTFPK